jgi:hypothetical protein
VSCGAVTDTDMYTTVMYSTGAPPRRALAAIAALIVATAAPTASRLVQSDAPHVLDIALPPAQDQYREPVEQAALESLRLYSIWLNTALPRVGVVTTTRSAEAASNVVVVSLPWRAADPMMEVQSHVAYEIARKYWTEAGTDPAIARGLSWYLQSRVVEHLFNLRYAAPGYYTEGLRFFGGHVPWVVDSLRVSRWRALKNIDGTRRLPAHIDDRVTRAAVAFASLERYLSWPVLQGALATLAAKRDTPLTAAHVDTTISAAAGQDLSWFFDFAFDPDRRVAYRLERFVTGVAEPDCGGCVRTTITAARLGDAVFSGSSRQRLGEFDSGSAITLQLQFAGGQSLLTHWDGRDERRDFVFESAAPATIATLDPEGVLLLDPNPLDHRLVQEPGTNVPLAKWLARWATWLQHAMLTYAMFV